MRVECLTQETGAPYSRSGEQQDDGDSEHYPCNRLVFFYSYPIHPTPWFPRDVAGDDGENAEQSEPNENFFIHKELLSKRDPQGLTLGDSSCVQLVLIFEDSFAVVQVTGRPVSESHRLPADVDDLTRLRPEGSSLGGTSDCDLAVVGFVPVVFEHVIASKLMSFRCDVRGHRPAAVLNMLVLLAGVGALGLAGVVHLLHRSNLSNEDDSAEDNMSPKKHNVKRVRHTARRTIRLITDTKRGCSVSRLDEEPPALTRSGTLTV